MQRRCEPGAEGLLVPWKHPNAAGEGPMVYYRFIDLFHDKLYYKWLIDDQLVVESYLISLII